MWMKHIFSVAVCVTVFNPIISTDEAFSCCDEKETCNTLLVVQTFFDTNFTFKSMNAWGVYFVCLRHGHDESAVVTCCFAAHEL